MIRRERLSFFGNSTGKDFVNEYRLDSISDDKKRLVFVSESIENIPAGWRAKEVLIIDGKKLVELFYLAEPGKDYEEYTKAYLEK